MMKPIQLEHLTIAELNILLGHLRLGSGHLKKQLSNKHYKHLLQLASLNMAQTKKITETIMEKTGNIALGLNTVITSVFGAWMGFSAFLGLRLNSYKTLTIITLIALIFCVFVGYFSYKLTTNNAKAAIDRQKLHNLQNKIFDLLIIKHQQSCESLQKFLNNSLRYIQDRSIYSFPLFKKNHDKHVCPNIATDFNNWLEELANAVKIKSEIIEEKRIYKFYSERLLRIVDKLQSVESFENKTRIESKSELSMRTKRPNSLDQINLPQKPITSHLPMVEEEHPSAIEQPTESTVIDVLTQQKKFHNPKPVRRSWLLENFLGLAAGGIPTLLGGFASMFVFLAGAPNLAKEFNLINLEHNLHSQGTRILALSIAIALTLYYVSAFIYSNYKNYIRQHELEKTNKQLVQLEEKSIELEDRVHLLTKIKVQIRRIINIYTAIENIASYREADWPQAIDKE